jgi:xanthine dehydrogenase YagT iron-sulfur-binding subunit
MVKTPTLMVGVGAQAPNFEIADACGSRVRLSDFRGRPVVLAFFPSDWDPSRPHQLALYNKVLGELTEGGRLIGVASAGDWCEVDMRAEGALRFPVLPGLADRPDIARLYGVQGRQALLVLDSDGVVTWRHVAPAGAYPPPDEFARALREKAASGLSRRQFLVAAAAVSLAAALLPQVSSARSVVKLAPGARKRKLTLDVNGRRHEIEADPRTTLLDALRDRIGLAGTKKGCDHGQCGACTVHLNGRRVVACLTLAAQAEGSHVTTVEGLAHGEKLHPVQSAFIKHDGYQCGYCTSGQIMSAVACIHEGHTGSDEEIKEWMSGNICRCAAYPNIVAAIKQAAGLPT